MIDSSTVWVVIPAFNEAQSIERAIKDVQAFGYSTLVVDDGSADETVNVSKKAGASDVIMLGVNKGYDAALNAGLNGAINKENCQWCVTFDADAQFDAKDIKKLLEFADNKNAMGAFGIRPVVGRLSERIVSACVNVVTGLKDPLCGLKCFRADMVGKYSESAGQRINMELAAKICMLNGEFVVQEPVNLKPRYHGVSLFSARFSGAFRILRQGLGMVPYLMWWKIWAAKE